jgi:hypothetical protein
MRGENYDQLASVCEGCHRIIHFGKDGSKYSPDETDRLLLTRDESAEFPPIKVDLRKRWGEHPPEWTRMSAVQRGAWNREYNRLWFIGKLQRNSDPKLTNIYRRTLYGYGMDDRAIDLAIPSVPRKRVRCPCKCFSLKRLH